MRLIYIVYMYVRSKQVPRKFVERRPSRFVIRPSLQPLLIMSSRWIALCRCALSPRGNERARLRVASRENLSYSRSPFFHPSLVFQSRVSARVLRTFLLWTMRNYAKVGDALFIVLRRKKCRSICLKSE